jgi:hypothetical protein
LLPSYINSNGAVLGCPCLAVCEGIFRNISADILGWFAKNLGIYIFYVKIVSVIMKTKITNSKREIETDFLMVTLAFKNAFMVLQKLRNHSFKSVHFN